MLLLTIADIIATQSAMARAQAVCDQLNRDRELIIEAFTPLASRLSRSLLLGPEPQPETRMVVTCGAVDRVPVLTKQEHEIGFRSRTL
jgi:hypothetical protein